MTTYTWTGTGGDDLWSNANNWSPNSGPPQTPDTAVIGTDNNSVAVNGTSGVGTLDLGFFIFQNAVGSTLTVDNGANFDVDGASNIFDASTLQSQTGGTIYFDFDGTLMNAGTVLLGQVISAGGGSSNLFIEGAVTLSGGGTVDLGQLSHTPLVDSTANVENFPSTSDSLVNQNNTIAGAGSIILGGFDNQAGGTVDASQQEGSPLQIAAGTLSNEGNMAVESRATLDLGQDGTAGSLTNAGTIDVDDGGTLAISGNFTISGDGTTLLAPGATEQQPSDQIVSDGSPAQLTLNGQTLKGAGTIGDGNLTLDNASGTIEANVAGEDLTLDAGAEIANGGSLEGTNNGTLRIFSNVDNLGTIAANGGTVLTSAVDNQGTIAANGGGMVDIEGSVSSTGGNPAIDIGADSGMTLSASVAGNVTFTGGGAGLGLNNSLANGGISGAIVGAETTDYFTFPNVSFSSSLQTSWQQNGSSGTLSLVEGGATLASVNLAGQYTNSDFAISPFLFFNTVFVELVNPKPPSATTADMVMENGATGDFEIYDLGSNAIQSAGALGQPIFLSVSPFFDTPAAEGAAAGPEWQVAGLGDFGADIADTSDMMLRDSLTGSFEVWNVANNNIIAFSAIGQVGLEWTVSGFGDFSGNADETDMLMRNSNTGQFEIYDISNDAITSAASMGQVGLEWSVAGFGDFSTRPNETDMLMRNNNSGAFELYDISNNTITSAAPMGAVGLEWSVAGFGDFSGNPNETDMLMRNTNTGAFEIYDISNNTITNFASMGAVGLAWQVVGFGPMDGAGSSDMLMRNNNTGAFEIYDISNNQLTNAAPMGQVGLEWAVGGIAAVL